MVPGSKHTPEAKARLSRSKTGPNPHLLPDTHWCPACKRSLPRSAFHTRSRKLATGEVVLRFVARCKACDNKRIREAGYKRTRAQADRANMLKRQARRIAKGEPIDGDRVLVDPQPLVDFIATLDEGDRAAIPEKIHKRLSDIRLGKQKRIGILLVNEACEAIGLPEQPRFLYPDL